MAEPSPSGCTFGAKMFICSWGPILLLAVAAPNVLLLVFFSDVAAVPGAASYGTVVISSLADIRFSNIGLALIAIAFLMLAVLYVLGWPTWSDVGYGRKRKKKRISLLQFATASIVFVLFAGGCIMRAIKWPLWSRIVVICSSIFMSWGINSWRQRHRTDAGGLGSQSLVRSWLFMVWLFVCLLVTSFILAGSSLYHLYHHPDNRMWQSYRENYFAKYCESASGVPCLYEKVLQMLAEHVGMERTNNLTLADCKMPSESKIVKAKPEMFNKLSEVCQQSEAVFFTLFLTQFIYVAACPVALVAFYCECCFRKTQMERVDGYPNPRTFQKVVAQLIMISFWTVAFICLLMAVSGAHVNYLNGVVSVFLAVCALSLAWAAWNASRIYEVLEYEVLEPTSPIKVSPDQDRRTSDASTLCHFSRNQRSRTHIGGDLAHTDLEERQPTPIWRKAEHLKSLVDNEWVQALMLMSGFVPLFYLLEKIRRSKPCRRCLPEWDDDHQFNRASLLFLCMLEGPSSESSSLRHLENSPASSPPLSYLNICSVLIKVCLISELYFSIQLGSKMTYVFLSYMIEVLAPLELGYIMLLVFIVGFIMFMLPVVPGVAVYVFIGILVPDAVVDRKKPDEENEFAVFVQGVIVAVFLALLLKLVACAGQYYIGYFLGQDMRIQKQFNVDQKPMRAAASVLSGRTRIWCFFGKVIVLVGGPDWPVSVVCGIIKTNIWSMLLYTIPVAVIQLPCILSGAYMIKAKPNEQTDDSTRRNLWSLIAAAAQGTSTLGAMYVGQLAYTKDPELLDQPPEDPDELRTYNGVQALREAERHDLEVWEQVLKDTRLLSERHFFRSGCIIFLAACMSVASAAMLTFAFENFELSSKISDDIDNYGLGGSPWNIVKPVGWIVLAVFAVSVILHVLFVKAKTMEAEKKTQYSRVSQESGDSSSSSS